MPGSPEALSSVEVRVVAEMRSAVGVRIEGVGVSGPTWARSRWRISRADLDTAGLSGETLRFGVLFVNSSAPGNAGLGYFVDNTLDNFEVVRFIDPNEDGDCADATPG